MKEKLVWTVFQDLQSPDYYLLVVSDNGLYAFYKMPYGVAHELMKMPNHFWEVWKRIAQDLLFKVR